MNVQELPQRLAAMSPAEVRRILAALGREELLELERVTESLMRYIPRVSPTLKSPLHLQPIVDVFESSLHTEQRVVISAPPQHGKTVVATHALPWLMGRNPRKRNGYVSYAADRAWRMSAEIRDVARAAGLRTRGSRKYWSLPQKGSLLATGIGGPLTGEGIDGALVIDDPVKNAAVAESLAHREQHYQWFNTTATSRVHPGGSIIVIQTRWHEDDLAGRLIKQGWRKINLQAVDDFGKALWEEQRPAAWLAEVRKQVLEYVWWALYQGEPRPRGGALFINAQLHKGLPNLEAGFQVGVGIDLAYSRRTRADWSVAITLARAQNLDPSIKPIYYVLDLQRQQVKAPVFKETLQALREKYPYAKMRWYAGGGGEMGVGDFLATAEGDVEGLDVEVLPAKNDKLARAQPLAAAWNDGRILVPEDAPWGPALVQEVTNFTGVTDVHDDQVDALAAAYDVLQPTSDEEHLRRRLAAYKNWRP